MTTPDDLANADGVLKELLFHEMLARGIYLAGRGFVATSLAIGDSECDTFMDALTNTVSSIGT